MPTRSAATLIMYRGRVSAMQVRPRVLLRRLLQVLERLALGLRELLRDGDLDAGDQVAGAAALQLRRAAAAQAEQLPVLGAGRHLQRHLAAGGGRDVDVRAERRLAERDRHLDDEVGLAAALEE